MEGWESVTPQWQEIQVRATCAEGLPETHLCVLLFAGGGESTHLSAVLVVRGGEAIHHRARHSPAVVSPLTSAKCPAWPTVMAVMWTMESTEAFC